MKFTDLLRIVGEEPVFETGLLLAGDVSAADITRQLSRWSRAGRILQVRRGIYVLTEPHGRSRPHPFLVANRMVRASYVSCQSALAYHGLVPEYVPEITSVTTRRTGRWQNALGRFSFRHLKPERFGGYQTVELGYGQRALLARPEKALLDLIYLEPGADRAEYLEALRLQNMEQLDLSGLARLAESSGSRKLVRAASRVGKLAQREQPEYEVS